MNILGSKLAAAMLALAMAAATPTLPAGTALPIMLGSTLSAKSDKVGQKIEGKLMQEVHLPSGAVIKKGAKVIGQVIAVQKPSRITVQFTALEDEHRTVALNVNLHALAAAESIFQAQLPVGNSTPEQSNEWVTQQVGGDYVFRGRGYVSSDLGKVGLWTGEGVVGRLSAGEDCLDFEGNGQEQALWLFSTAACGAYGYNKKLTIVHDGRTAPLGQITLESTAKELQVRSGSGLLLVVNSQASGTPASRTSSGH